MKKLFSLLLVFAMILSLCACGGNSKVEAYNATKEFVTERVGQLNFSDISQHQITVDDGVWTVEGSGTKIDDYTRRVYYSVTLTLTGMGKYDVITYHIES